MKDKKVRSDSLHVVGGSYRKRIESLPASRPLSECLQGQEQEDDKDEDIESPPKRSPPQPPQRDNKDDLTKSFSGVSYQSPKSQQQQFKKMAQEASVTLKRKQGHDFDYLTKEELIVSTNGSGWKFVHGWFVKLFFAVWLAILFSALMVKLCLNSVFL